jgi:glycosyltransferase involved in cell wall biosynthesis
MQRIMHLSFVIPVYNAAPYLEKCVESIFQSELSDDEIEIIFVDDGSTDNSVEVAQQLCEKHTQVSLYTQKNQGSSVARNTGMQYVTGDYIWFVDSDDYIDSAELKEIYDKINENKDLDIFAVQIKIEDGENSRSECTQSALPHNVVLSGRDSVLQGYQPSSACALICRADFLRENNLSFYVGISHQDVEFSMRAMSLAKNVIFSDLQPYIYIKHSGSVSRAKTAEKLYFYMIGDLYVALSYKKFVESLEDKKLINHILCWSNSILCNLLMSLKRAENPIIDKTFKEKMLKEMSDHDAYPIHGPFFSWKMTVYSWLLNMKKFII